MPATASWSKDGVELIRLLRNLVSIRSYNPPGEEEAIGNFTADWLAAAGFIVSRQAVLGSRSNVIGRLPGQGQRPALLLCAHLDTVPPGDLPWTVDPLDGAEVSGRVYGRGTADTKGALAAMLLAGAKLASSSKPRLGDLIILGTVDEETHSTGARAYLESTQMDGIGAVVIGEPTSLNLVTSHRGLVWMEVTACGRSAHGSMPEEGANAILPMVDFIRRLTTSRGSYIDDRGQWPETTNVGTIQGGVKTNMVPDRCSVTIDFRTTQEHTHDRVVRRVHDIIDDTLRDWPSISIEAKVINDKSPLATLSDQPLVRLAIAAYRATLGYEPSLGHMPYATDGSYLAGVKGLSAIIFGPGQESMAHQRDEYVMRSEVLQAEQFYYTLAEAYLCD